MSKLISVNENGVIYVESDSGEVFGIVSVTEITDEDGIEYESQTLNVLDLNGFELEEDYENELTTIKLETESGELCKIVFNNTHVDLVCENTTSEA